MKKIKFELLKVLNIKMVVLMAFFVILESVLLVGNYSNITGITKETYPEYVRLINLVTDIPYEKSEEQLNLEISKYNEEIDGQKIFVLRKVLNEKKNIENFNVRIQTIINNGKKMNEASIFQNQSSSLNICKTIADYETIEGIEIKYKDRIGILNFIFSWKEDFFILISSIIFILSLFYYERVHCLEDLVYTQKMSKAEMIRSKLSTAFLVFVFLFILFYSMSFIYQFLTYGFNGLSDPVQSAIEFVEYARPFTFLQVIILILVFKFILLYTSIVIIVLIFEYTREIKKGLTIIGLLIVIEALFYFITPFLSDFSMLKKINFFNFFNYRFSLFTYENFDLFKMLVSSDVCIFLVLIVIASISTLGLCKVALKRNREVSALKNEFRINLYGKLSRKFNIYHLYFQELYYGLVNQKIVLLILISLLFNFYSFKSTNRIIGLDTHYYNIYTQMFQGKMDKGKENQIAKLKNEIELNKYMLNEMEKQMISGDISAEEYYATKIKFSDLEGQRLGLQKMQNQLNIILSEDKYIFNNRGWRYLFQLDIDSTGANYANLDLLIMMLLLLSFVSIFYGMEYDRSKSAEIIETTVSVNKQQAVKKKCGIIIMFLLCVPFFFRYWYTAKKILGISGGNAHLDNLIVSETLLSKLSFNLINILFIVHRGFILYFVTLLMMEFAKRSKNILFSLVSIFAIFIFPIIGAICEIQALYMFSISNLFINVQNMLNWIQWEGLFIFILFIVYGIQRRKGEKI